MKYFCQLLSKHLVCNALIFYFAAAPLMAESNSTAVLTNTETSSSKTIEVSNNALFSSFTNSASLKTNLDFKAPLNPPVTNAALSAPVGSTNGDGTKSSSNSAAKIPAGLGASSNVKPFATLLPPPTPVKQVFDSLFPTSPKPYVWMYTVTTNSQGVLPMEFMKSSAPFKLAEINYGAIVDNLTTDINNAFLWYQDTIQFEGQLGILALTPTNGSLNLSGAILFKLNLGSAKRPRIAEVSAALARIDSRLWAHGLTVSPVMRERLAAIQEGVISYPVTRWFRPSVAVYLPFNSTNVDPAAWNQNDGLARILHFNQVGLLLGWDLFDYATVYGGVDLSGRGVFGAGLDLTTTAYSLSSAFSTFVRQLFRTPN